MLQVKARVAVSECVAVVAQAVILFDTATGSRLCEWRFVRHSPLFTTLEAYLVTISTCKDADHIPIW